MKDDMIYFDESDNDDKISRALRDIKNEEPYTKLDPTASSDEPQRITHPAVENHWLTTFTGRRVMLPNIQAKDVLIVDIAHSLGMQCRYLGQCRDFYSVAEHSVLVMKLAQLSGETYDVQKACLMHDVHEAYVGDFPSPFKHMVPGLKDFEREIETNVRAALSLPEPGDPVWDVVKHYDIIALHLEAQTLLCKPGWIDRRILRRVPRYKGLNLPRVIVKGWIPEIATEMFLREAAKFGYTINELT